MEFDTTATSVKHRGRIAHQNNKGPQAFTCSPLPNHLQRCGAAAARQNQAGSRACKTPTRRRSAAKASRPKRLYISACTYGVSSNGKLVRNFPSSA